MTDENDSFSIDLVMDGNRRKAVDLRQKLNPPVITVYLASAMTGRSEEESRLDNELRSVVIDVVQNYEHCGLTFQCYNPAKETFIGSEHTADIVYKLDHENVAGCDVAFFLYNAPHSDGRGIETQIAADATIPRLLLVPKGVNLSRLPLGIYSPTLATVEFSSAHELQTKLFAVMPEMAVALIPSVIARRAVLASMQTEKVQRFLFKRRVVLEMTLQKLATTTDIQEYWLRQLEVDAKKTSTLTLVQLRRLADALGAQLSISDSGLVKLIPLANDLSDIQNTSLNNLYEAVLTLEEWVTDEILFGSWKDFVAEEKVEKLAARGDANPVSVMEWRQRLEFQEKRRPRQKDERRKTPPRGLF